MGNINLFSYAGVTSSARDNAFIALFLIVGVVMLLLTVFLLTKYIYAPRQNAVVAEGQSVHRSQFSFGGMFWALAALGLVLRLILAFAVRGYREELSVLSELVVGTKELGEIYSVEKSMPLHPVVIYLYSFVGMIASNFSVTASDGLMPFFVKLPLIICDICLAGVVYRAAKKYINEYCALILSGFTVLFPAFIFASSVWGSLFSLYTLVIVLCFYFVATKNFPLIILTYSIALLTMKDALFVFPAVAIFLIYNFCKYVTMLSSAPRSIHAIMEDKELRNVVLIPCSIVVMIILSYLATLPLLHEENTGFFRWMSIIYFYPLRDVTMFGHNALNVFNLFLRNGVTLEIDFPIGVFATLFAIIASALVALVYLSRKNRANLCFLAAYIVLTLSIFFMGFSELNLLPVIALTLLSFILIRDRRLLKVVGLLGFAVLLNASAVMACAGYLGNLPMSELSSSNELYTGYTLLKEGGALAVSIICSLTVIFTFVYATFILLDLSMSDKRKMIERPDKVNIVTALINFFKI